MQKICFYKLLQCNANLQCILDILNKFCFRGYDFTLDEIGKILHMSKERVRQIEQTALKKIRHPKLLRKLYEYKGV